MSVVFMILKIIGMILLCLLGIVICLLILILFVPIRYQIHGIFQEQLKDKRIVLRLTYLLHLVVFTYQNRNGKAGYQIKILGHVIGRKIKKEQIDTIPEIPNVPRTEKTDTQEARVAIHDKPKVDKVPSKGKQKHKKIKSKRHGISLKRIREVLDEWKTAEDGSQIQYLQIADKTKRMLKSLLKHYQPRKVKGNISFSLEDPSLTGKLCGVLSLMPVFLNPGVKVEPDFERFENAVEGDLFVSGKVELFYMAIWALKLLLDKNIRKLYTKMKEK